MESYVERSRKFARDLIEHRVPDQARKVAQAILMLSYEYREGRDAAPVDEQQDLAESLGMNHGDCNTAIGLLQDMGIMRVLRCAGRWWFEPRPDSQYWSPRPATRKAKKARKSARAGSAEEREKMRMAWARLEAGGDPQQAALPMDVPTGHRPVDDGGFGDAMAAASREPEDMEIQSNFGISKPARPATPDEGEKPVETQSNFGISKVEPSAPPTDPADFGNSKLERKFQSGADFGNSKVTHVRAGHAHEHASKATPYMPHEHGTRGVGERRGARRAPPPLTTPAQFDLMNRINELVPDEDEQRAFHTNWTWRIHEWPNEVFKAIGETRIAGIEGRINTTPGRFMNSVFKDFRDSALKRRRATHPIDPNDDEHAKHHG